MRTLKRSAIPGLFWLALYGCGDDGKTDMTEIDSSVTASDGGAPDTGTSADGLSNDVALPIVFVHGFAGSASQYESQAIRFIANGYPAERIRGFDHDGAGFNTASFIPGVDATVDAALKDFGASKVYLVGHSRGTFVSSMYLADAARAAKVAKYVSLDGSGCAAAEAASVPCIAPSQTTLPGQKHVEVATSAESFVEQFKFFIGREPSVTKIVKQTSPVVISGRVVNFPANTGRAGTTLSFYEINQASGARAQAEPLTKFEIKEDGDWGPVTVSPDKFYELTLTAPDSGTQHFYPQRFLRSSHLVRLLSGGPDSPSRMNTNAGDKHAALTVLRMREWTSDDILEVKAVSPSGNAEAVNAITQAVGTPMASATGLSFLPIGLYIHDDKATPGMTSLALLPYFSTQPFQSGVDVFLPASDPPTGTITLTNMPRGDKTKPQVLNMPNWPSIQHSITVMFADYAQE
jgi:pimeloyl-ACP methyl ester carboxylesterase